jgi:predicted nucleic acid-binding protein
VSVVLADSSAWVEYDRATGSRVDQRLMSLIRDDGRLATTEPVIMEITSGARSDMREAELRNLLLRFELLRFDPVVDFDGATTIYRNCRKAGITPRGLIDCLIASVVQRHDATLLTFDADQIRIATVVPFELDQACPGID